MTTGDGKPSTEFSSALPSERIRQTMGELPAGERKVARFLLTDYPMAGLVSARALAERSNTSAPTVTRYVARLGYAAYRDFQEALRAELQARMSSPMVAAPTRYDEHTPVAQMLREGGEANAALLKASLQSVAPTEFEEAVKLLADARLQIAIVGGRFSRIVAELLYFHLRMLRPNTRYHPSSAEMNAITLADLRRRDVLVVFDFRRYQRDVVEFARDAQAGGAQVVVVTDAWLSPAAQFADVVLPVRTDNTSPFDSLAPVTAIVETLAAAVLIQLGDHARTRNNDVESRIDFELHLDEGGVTKISR